MIIPCLLLILTINLSAREKTEQIANFTWYTEQNTLEEMAQIAQKADKPIFAVFSAVWCGPCQQVKKTVFMTDDFKRIADSAILLYIEQTTPEGDAYNKKFNVSAFPTFKLISKDGIFLDHFTSQRTVDGFLNWINDVKAGNNFYQLSKKLEQYPQDRDLIIKIVEKLDYFQVDDKIEYLSKAITINPDFNDDISQKIYEKLASTLAVAIAYNTGDEKTKIKNKYQQLFLNIINAYYPGKFKYDLKENDGFTSILNWFNESGNYDKTLSIFNDLLKQKDEKLNLIEEVASIANAVTAYVGSGKLEDAKAWTKKVQDAAKDAETLKKDSKFLYYYFSMYNPIITYLADKKEMKEAENIGLTMESEMTRLGQDSQKASTLLQLTQKYGILMDKTIESIYLKLKTAKNMELVYFSTAQAKLLVKSGKKDDASKVLINLYENEEFIKNLQPELLPEALNMIAWTMVECKIVNEKSLEIAKKALTLKPSHVIMDTVASIHAELGNFKEAVEIEKQALEKTNNEKSKKDYSDKIKNWEKEIK